MRAGGKHIMRCEKLLKNMFIVRDPPTPAWSTAKRPRSRADEGYRSAEGGFFRYAPSEKNIKPNVEVDKYRLRLIWGVFRTNSAKSVANAVFVESILLFRNIFDIQAD